jgi:transposase InsO family protein
VIRLKALGPELSCRAIAMTFNRRFAQRKRMTVGRSFVAKTLREQAAEIHLLRRQLRGRWLTAGPRNVVWGLDLTGKADDTGRQHAILGLLDHGSRANLSLVALRDKTTITILRHLLDAVERYGKPQAVRTDNEAVFTSRLLRFSLWLLGIRHQRIDPHCPWMNGRIERFFGTLKQKLDRWAVPDDHALQASLAEFRAWYNHVRPHQHLAGRTPAEVWAGIDIHARLPKEERWFTAWDGLLAGYYLRR